MSLNPRIPNASIASPRGAAQAIQDLRRDVAQLKAPNLKGSITYMYLAGGAGALGFGPPGAAGRYDVITLNTAVTGMSSGADTANSRFVASSAGNYWVRVMTRWTNAPSDQYVVSVVFKNGVYWGPWGDTETGYAGSGATIAVPMVAGDYIDYRVWHDGTTTWTIAGGLDNTHMLVMKAG